MASYILRDIDRDLFKRARAKSQVQGCSLKSIVEQILAAWLRDDMNLTAELFVEWGFKAAERGWNLDNAIAEFRKVQRGQS